MLELSIENLPLGSVSFTVSGPVKLSPVTLNLLVTLLPTDERSDKSDSLVVIVRFTALHVKV